MKLQGRVAIITGSASGVGRAGAILFAKEGARVVLADINEQGGQETEKVIRETGGMASFVSTDVSKPPQVESMVKVAIERYQRLNILWNNAGATKLCNEEDRPVHLLPESVWDQMLAVTLKGMYLCSKYVLPHMMAAGRGVVINTSSTDALVGQGGYDSYTAAKGGIVSMTRSMAVYYSKFGIRVNAICPGFVHTELQDPWMNNPKSRSVIEGLHLTRVGIPEDIAKFALYLASDDAEYVTGGVFAIDGGLTAFKTHETDYSAG
ncbi:MAG TPA: glucose 1-dehydrogenase [Terriglobia bacterium]|nr:glucose 1-dehydrogenase [Terriglobia bacterium]